jgi:hypothetical protein
VQGAKSKLSPSRNLFKYDSQYVCEDKAQATINFLPLVRVPANAALFLGKKPNCPRSAIAALQAFGRLALSRPAMIMHGSPALPNDPRLRQGAAAQRPDTVHASVGGDMPSTSSSSRNWTIFRVISAYMILLFLWRVFVPAHEYSMRTAQVLDIAINILLLVGLVSLKRQLDREFEADDSRWSFARPLYRGGLIAGVLMLLIRLTSDAAWWTGHLRYSLD